MLKHHLKKAKLKKKKEKKEAWLLSQVSLSIPFWASNKLYCKRQGQFESKTEFGVMIACWYIFSRAKTPLPALIPSLTQGIRPFGEFYQVRGGGSSRWPCHLVGKGRRTSRWWEAGKAQPLASLCWREETVHGARKTVGLRGTEQHCIQSESRCFSQC